MKTQQQTLRDLATCHGFTVAGTYVLSCQDEADVATLLDAAHAALDADKRKATLAKRNARRTSFREAFERGGMIEIDEADRMVLPCA